MNSQTSPAEVNDSILPQAEGGCLQQAGSPVSQTPECDLLERTTLNPADWMALARKMERERNAARVPICIGRPIIEILAKEGMWTSINGSSVVAADCLFGRNPYQENDALCDGGPQSTESK